MSDPHFRIASFEAVCIVGPIIAMGTVTATALGVALTDEGFQGIVAGHLMLGAGVQMMIFGMVIYLASAIKVSLNTLGWLPAPKTDKQTSPISRFLPRFAVSFLALSLMMPTITATTHAITLNGKVNALDITTMQRTQCISEFFLDDRPNDAVTLERLGTFASRIVGTTWIREKFEAAFESCAKLETNPAKASG